MENATNELAEFHNMIRAKPLLALCALAPNDNHMAVYMKKTMNPMESVLKHAWQVQDETKTAAKRADKSIVEQTKQPFKTLRNRIDDISADMFVVFRVQWHTWAERSIYQVVCACECALESGGIVVIDGVEANFGLEIVESHVFDPDINDYFGCPQLRSPLGLQFGTGTDDAPTETIGTGPAQAKTTEDGSNRLINIYNRGEFSQAHKDFVWEMLSLSDLIAIAIGERSFETSEKQKALESFPHDVICNFLKEGKALTEEEREDAIWRIGQIKVKVADSLSESALNDNSKIRHCIDTILNKSVNEVTESDMTAAELSIRGVPVAL